MKNLLSGSILGLTLLSTTNSFSAYEERTYPTHPTYSYNYSYYAFARHYLYGLSNARDLIELEDGSQWKVNPHDLSRIRHGNWNTGDPLCVSANNYFFSSGGGYYITNLKTGAYVRALLHAGPIEESPYTRHVSAIDHQEGILYLENGLAFTLNKAKATMYRGWLSGHTIIIGSNDDWFRFSRNDYILINVDKNEYIEAEQY